MIPMKRMGQSEEDSDLLLYLVSDASIFATEAEFVITAESLKEQ